MENEHAHFLSVSLPLSASLPLKEINLKNIRVFGKRIEGRRVTDVESQEALTIFKFLKSSSCVPIES